MQKRRQDGASGNGLTPPYMNQEANRAHMKERTADASEAEASETRESQKQSQTGNGENFRPQQISTAPADGASSPSGNSLPSSFFDSRENGEGIASPLSASLDDINDALDSVTGVLSGKGSVKVQAEKAVLTSLCPYIKKPFVTAGWEEDVALSEWVDCYGKGVKSVSATGQIVHLDLYRTDLAGDISPMAKMFGKIEMLEVLNLQGNQELVGSLDHVRLPLRLLRALNVSDTGLSGHLSVFSEWERCEELIACRCAQLSGDDGLLPLLPMKNLKKVEVSDTQELKGIIPDELTARGVQVEFKGSGLRCITQNASIHQGLFPLFVLPRDAILSLQNGQALPLHLEESTRQQTLKVTRVYQPFNSYHLEGTRCDAQDERYVSRNKLAYVSHQGISVSDLKVLVQSYPGISFWWLDSWSMPKENEELWREAKLSLPYYIKMCGSFVAVASASNANPQHRNSRPDSLEGNGWARLERLCACAPLRVELHTSGSTPSGRKKQGPILDVTTEVVKFDCVSGISSPYNLGALFSWKLAREDGSKQAAEKNADGKSEFHDWLDPSRGSFASSEEKSIADKISCLVADKFAGSALCESALKAWPSDGRRTEEDGGCKMQ